MAKKPAKTTKTTSKSGGKTTSTSGKRATGTKSVAKKPAAATTAAKPGAKTAPAGSTSGTRTLKKQAAPAKKKAAAPAKLAGAPLGTRWLTGIGDERNVCAATAVGNSLLSVLGIRPSDRDIERLYRAAGGHGDSGVPVEAVLEAAETAGISGCRIASWRPATSPEDASLLLLSLDVTPDLHAVAHLGGSKVATWGDDVPLSDLSAEIIGAWHVAWHQ